VKLNKTPKDLEKWVKWLNNKNILIFSEQRFSDHTIKTQRKFLTQKFNSKTSIIFKIIFNRKFIGVVELGNISKTHKTCEVMYFIGEENLWGRNIGTSAVREAVVYAKKKLKMYKVSAGTYSRNISSQKVLLKNKFRVVGKLRKHFIIDENSGLRDDKILFDKLL
jgi:RimJ/RimL family protein N-acetyltransferase